MRFLVADNVCEKVIPRNPFLETTVRVPLTSSEAIEYQSDSYIQPWPPAKAKKSGLGAHRAVPRMCLYTIDRSRLTDLFVGSGGTTIALVRTKTSIYVKKIH